jgi:hypothetical protein
LPADPILGRVAERVRAIAAGYRPPGFEHVPDPDSAIFLCAVDHKAGYRGEHLVEGRGPYRGSALMWEAGLAAARREPGLLTAARLASAGEADVDGWFEVEGDRVADPARRAALWRNLADGLLIDHGGSAQALLDAADGSLTELLALLRPYRAYADPLGKKSYLLAKIAQRRGWFEASDPRLWQVSADSVLMRIALRSGLVAPGPLERVRADTRARLRMLADASGVEVPVLDDMIWELGREDPDLLGTDGGDIREPSRDPGSAWF